MTKTLLSPEGEAVTLNLDIELALFGVLSWASQVRQYPEVGPPGVDYMLGEVPGGQPPVHCVLWRDGEGKLRGILNYYEHEYGGLEKPGNFLVLVDPAWQRKGIASLLLNVMEWRWQPINWSQQRYSKAGIAVVSRFLTTQRGYTEVSK